MPQVLLYKWTLVERERDREMEPNERKEMQSFQLLQKKRNPMCLNHRAGKERALKPKGPLKKGKKRWRKRDI